MRWIVVILTAIFLGALARGSLIEDLTQVRYQDDGDPDHYGAEVCLLDPPSCAGDASDVCAEPRPMLPLDIFVHGLLAPPDDLEDDYGMPIGPELIGTQVTVLLDPSHGLEDPLGVDYDLVVWRPGCPEPPIGESHRIGGYAERVQFPVVQPGLYTVQVLPGLAHAINPPDLGPGARGCDPMCNVAGYHVRWA